MTKLFQTAATIAREQNHHLFEDTLDPCFDGLGEFDMAKTGELLNSIDPQRQQRTEKVLGDILQDLAAVRKTVTRCHERCTPPVIIGATPEYGSGWLRANVEWRYTHGRYGDVSYRTLALSQRGSFVKWAHKGPDGKTQHKSLFKFLFYPALITENMRMAFVRATKGQITYLRDGTERSIPKAIGKTLFKTSVYFPMEDTHRCNAVIMLEHLPGGEKCELGFLFDGEQFHLTEIVSSASFYDKGFDALVKKELAECPAALDVLLGNCFRPFSVSELDIDRKNLEDYLSGHKYKVGIAEAARTPILVLHKDNRVL